MPPMSVHMLTWLLEHEKRCQTLEWSIQSQTCPDLLDAYLILALSVSQASVIFQRVTHAQADHCRSWSQ